MTASTGRPTTTGDQDAAADARRLRRADRLPLSPERIYRTALDIISRDGPEALTMRRVASALHVEPMSLYHHVPSKKALLDGVVGLAMSGVGTFDDLEGTWQDQLREAARRVRRELLAHPRAAALVATRPVHSEQLAVLVESGLERLTDLGFELRVAAEVLWTLNDYVTGNVLNRIGSQGGTESLVPSPEDSKRLAETFTPDRFPKLLAATLDDTAEDDLARFERGLDALIAGITSRGDTPGT